MWRYTKPETTTGAISAFQEMLSKMEQPPDPGIHREFVLVVTVKMMICWRHPIEHRRQYKIPLGVRAKIRRIAKATTRHSPLELIDMSTGKIHGRDERIVIFESSPICKELISSMATHINLSCIRHVVRRYFQYVVLSHKWEDQEPLFQEAIRIAVYDLGDPPTHNKLQTYCSESRFPLGLE